MALFWPLERKHTVLEVTPPWLETLGAKAIILDIDNTLTTHGNPVPADGVPEWIDAMKQAGVGLIVVSNNDPERVQPFADRIGVPFIADGGKPFGRGIGRACRTLGVSPKETVMLGDQLFTDMLGGNVHRMITVLVDPIEPEENLFFRIKRLGERICLKGYDRKKGNRR